MEEKAPFGVKEALLCVVVSAALATGATAMYLVWSTKMQRDSSAVEEGASDLKKLLPRLGMDQLPEALEQIEICRMNLLYFEMAVLAERVANCFEENGDLEQAVRHRLLASGCYLRVNENQRAYDVVLHCLPLTHTVLFQCELMCAIASTLLLSPKALEHFNRCEELAPSSEIPKANLAYSKRERNSAGTPQRTYIMIDRPP